LEKIKNNKLVSSSVDVCNIAKEVYTSVQNQEQKDKELEEHYIEATTKISYVPRDVIRNRIDFKVLHSTASTGRKV